ncbi:hypothetical protein CYMTET_38740 [Cymbomonas tetramitiformis]|uniref:Uncharacterized protein n=1 Tax=Cymbomonas tetramitiformis TaxID=36881 RepID=A0AAE0F4Y9_9CHLO|nr:hypothetical protein CYMTET_38740 [Cymbomonas tetramitiformis]
MHGSATPSVVSDDDTPRPVSALHAHEPDLHFADRIAQLGGLLIADEGRQPALTHMHAETDGERAEVDNGDDADYSDDEDASFDDETSPTACPYVPAQFVLCFILCLCHRRSADRCGFRCGCWHRHAHGSTDQWCCLCWSIDYGGL